MLGIYWLSVLSLIISFFVTLMVIPWLIKKMSEAGITGRDMNKDGKPLIPEMGGIAVVIGFNVGVFFWLSIGDIGIDILLLASIYVILATAFVGLLDDLVGIRQRTKALLPFIFSIPLGIYVESTSLSFPFIGSIDFGWLMILIVPFGVTCAANAANMLEGFNGLGCGLGIIITITLIIISLIQGIAVSLYLLFPLLGALIAFLIFNKYPAKIFPGDSLTLFVGATIACAAILGDLKTIGAILFFPMIIEFFLKFRGRFTAENFVDEVNNGYLFHRGSIQSLTHLVMQWKKLKEWQLVALFWIMEGILCVAMIIFVLNGIF